MKITVDFLKQESCNFDLECVFSLDLSKKSNFDTLSEKKRPVYCVDFKKRQ